MVIDCIYEHDFPGRMRVPGYRFYQNKEINSQKRAPGIIILLGRSLSYTCAYLQGYRHLSKKSNTLHS